MITPCVQAVTGLSLCCIASLVSAEAGSGEELWADLEAADGVEHVNEGSLGFLILPPSRPVHAHHNRIVLATRSLDDGWASLYQCHTDLDAVPAAEVVFNEDRIRRLQVMEISGIGQATVEGASVQLEDVQPDGPKLCLAAESRVVESFRDGSFVVRNGPFMRRFLDGFFPMHVTLEIILPPGNWELAGSLPVAQAGFNVSEEAGGLRVDTWFEGELRTEFYFRARTLPRKN